jgi:hypothetical protein
VIGWKCSCITRSELRGASCEDWKSALREGWKSLTLHVSTSALHTSIARSGRSVQSSLRIIYTSKYLLNWFLFAFKLYKHAKLQILIATDKIKQRKRMIVCFEIIAFIFSGFGRRFISSLRFCSGSGSDIYIIFFYYIKYSALKRIRALIKVIISHVRLFMIISHVKLSLFNYRFSVKIIAFSTLEINLVFPRAHVLFSII